MPKGQYDRSKTKAQRDAEKAAEMKAAPKADAKVKAKPGPKPKKAVEESVTRAPRGLTFKTNLSALDRFDKLMDYATTLSNLNQAEAGNKKVTKAFQRCLERLEIVADELQPLVEEEKPVAVATKEYATKFEEKVAPTVTTATAPLPAPIQFNPPTPTNGAQ